MTKKLNCILFCMCDPTGKFCMTQDLVIPIKKYIEIYHQRSEMVSTLERHSGKIHTTIQVHFQAV